MFFDRCNVRGTNRQWRSHLANGMSFSFFLGFISTFINNDLHVNGVIIYIEKGSIWIRVEWWLSNKETRGALCRECFVTTRWEVMCGLNNECIKNPSEPQDNLLALFSPQTQCWTRYALLPEFPWQQDLHGDACCTNRLVDTPLTQLIGTRRVSCAFARTNLKHLHVNMNFHPVAPSLKLYQDSCN